MPIGDIKDMNKYNLDFHHIGLAVSSPDKALEFLRGLGYTSEEIILDEIQNVQLVLCSHPEMPNIEIIFRTKTRGPVDFILKDKSELMYHICYETESLEKTLKAFKKDGLSIRTLSKPKPAKLFQNHNISFYHVSGIGVIELLEK